MGAAFLQNPHLDGRPFYMAGEEVGILLVHGFTATTVEVRGLAEFLHKQGMAVSAPLLPGHGTAPEDMLEVTWRDWVEAVEHDYQELAGKSQKIVIAGESLGALLSLYLAARHPQIIGLVLYAPAIKVKRLWQSALLWPFLKIIPKGYSGADADGQLPWQGYNVVVVPAANQLRRLQGVIRRLLPRVHQPALIFQGEKDQTIDASGAQLIFDTISSEDKELVWLLRSGHCIILDVEREQVYQKTLDFITSVVKRQPNQILFSSPGV